MPAHADQRVRSRLPHRHGKQSSVGCKVPAEATHAAHRSAHLLANGSFSRLFAFLTHFVQLHTLWSVIWLCQSLSLSTID